MSGFIDPDAHDQRRIDRLEVLMEEALRHTDIVSAMSSEARAIYRDLLCEDPARVARARARIQQQMAADPLTSEEPA